ncbi:uncharacterized protein LOC100204492 [Hydra vulgaris]|uniref:Uncharacterized protein LOC136072133 n=1 Tax=Hydra vulgaris TaxID=6087 RepID=A0ABM4DQ43_HYDVU|nr:cofilin [Hydra vulgaris]XP_047127551.1 cofilin [Hydra vulgaris]
MTSSGFTIHPECCEVFNQFKSNCNKPTHDFLVMKPDKDKVVLDLCPPLGESATLEKYKNRENPAYDRMVDYLVEHKCRYAFYIFDVNTADGRRTKVVFFTYADDNAKAQEKMIMTTSKTAVEKGCPGFAVKIQANDRDDLSYKTVLEAVLTSK